jgi:O-antigen ligase
LREQLHAVAPAAFALLTVVLIVRDQGGYFPTSWGWSALALLAVVAVWAAAGGTTDAGRLDVAFLCALALLSAWAAVSTTWSVDRPQSVLEAERWLVLLAGCVAFVVLAARHAFASIAIALLAAITGICLYSLYTRLAPSAAAFQPRDPTSGYRLFEPVGYWNALGGFAVLGILLALGVAAEPTFGLARRVFGAASLVVLAPTLFFTYSRGSWLALAAGLLLSVIYTPHRLRLVLHAAVLAVVPALTVLLASRQKALTDVHATLVLARRQGRHLALALVGLALASGAASVLLAWAEARLDVGRRPRAVFAGVLTAAAVIGAVAVLAAGGGPVAHAKRAYDSFVAPVPPAQRSNLNTRLLELNGNGRAQLWSVAINSLHGRWLTGSGAGSFERNWHRSPKANEVVRDAHGLYVETLSELGLVGLALLVALLAMPLVAGLRARSRPLVPAIAGAYAAFLVHNAVDWDWELSGITLTGLFTGCLLLVAGRRGAERIVRAPVRIGASAGAVLLAGFAIVVTIGNGALARAQSANRAHRYADAASAALLAKRWMPWSPSPLKALGTAELELEGTAAARASFRRAVAIDSGDWQGWLDLAATLQGTARTRAVARARELYPSSPEIVEFEQAVGASGSSRAGPAVRR